MIAYRNAPVTQHAHGLGMQCGRLCSVRGALLPRETSPGVRPVHAFDRNTCRAKWAAWLAVHIGCHHDMVLLHPAVRRPARPAPLPQLLLRQCNAAPSVTCTKRHSIRPVPPLLAPGPLAVPALQTRQILKPPLPPPKMFYVRHMHVHRHVSQGPCAPIARCPPSPSPAQPGLRQSDLTIRCHRC